MERENVCQLLHQTTKGTNTGYSATTYNLFISLHHAIEFPPTRLRGSVRPKRSACQMSRVDPSSPGSGLMQWA